MKIPKLFVSLFIPTLIGLLFGAMLNLADGIFVGRGVGSDALAAVNIVSPLFLITTGVAMLFGSGVSVAAALLLSQGNGRDARINITQAFAVGMLLMALVSAVVMLFPRQTVYLLGGTDKLMPYAVDYLLWIAPGLPMNAAVIIGVFVLRIDGAPRFAMAVQAAVAILNAVLDYIAVFPLQMGTKGAAIVTTISDTSGAVCVLYYMLFRARALRFCSLRFSAKGIRTALRNAGNMAKLGMSAFIGETGLLCMTITGNYMFVSKLGEDGVAAFGIACYLFPLVFMIGNAVAQSALPIISYNYGLGNWQRIRHTRRISVLLAVICGLFTTALGVLFSPAVAGIFIRPGLASWQIAVEGFPWYSLGFVLFAVNIVFIGYYQSIERVRAATFFMLLRSLIVLVPIFILLPRLAGDIGLWLAVPVSELVTLAAILIYDGATGRAGGKVLPCL